MPDPTRLTRVDGLGVALLFAATWLYVARFFPFPAPPFEDAAISLRYAQHLSEGHGMVWNVGERPVDGATDFLFVLLLTGLVKLGASIELGARAVGFAAHFLTAGLVYYAVRTLHGAAGWVALASGAFLAVGPGLGYVAAYFSTPLFALLATLAWILAYRIKKDRGNPRANAVAFALAGLALGLSRPEGALLAAFMMLAIVVVKGGSATRHALLCFLGVFVVLGGAYFLWRWNYFGQPLPNPYYRKGGGALYFESLLQSVEHGLILSFPFIPAFVLGLRKPSSTTELLFALIPTGGFTSLWILLSGEMNYLMRFQYATLPLVLVSWPGMLQGIGRDFGLPPFRSLAFRSRISLLLTLGTLVLGALGVEHYVYAGAAPKPDGRREVGLVLSEYRRKSFTIATSESGLLPYYSRWRSVDTWGLNDRWIAQNGTVTEEYLDRYQPEMIVMHAYFSPLVPARGRGRWFDMLMVLKDYAEKRRYVLAACYGFSPYDTHYYYVKRDFPDSEELVRRVRNLDYHWFENGISAVDYARPGPVR